MSEAGAMLQRPLSSQNPQLGALTNPDLKNVVKRTNSERGGEGRLCSPAT